ncbi:serine/threonine-protein kinase [Microbacterium saperdae]|uniref:hypothetical protein n=1 Tax=Microbacterium saperdae TaxID=69368 RepID=UPI00114DBA5C|nr:hypothetical protein [Microbacterium saperdae]GGM46843.1 hypothetical protein GCM10010489_17640 [Microbacterium saperdae]
MTAPGDGAVGRFTTSDGQLYYAGEPVLDEDRRPVLPRLILDDAPLGAGANGVVFRATHRALSTTQVVKLYIPGDDSVTQKAWLEASKNANADLRDVVALVHDAGTFAYPRPISFSVMESVASIETLGQWFGASEQWRRALKSYAGAERISGAETRRLIRTTMLQEHLNALSGYLISVITLHSNGVIHGDLNNGNLLIEGEIPLAERWSVRPYFPDTGAGQLNPHRIKVIDLGSSQAAGTSSEVGKIRENSFLISAARRFLKPMLEDSDATFMELLRIEQEPSGDSGRFEPYFVKDSHHAVDPYELSSDLLRLTFVLNLVLGYSESSAGIDDDAHSTFDARGYSDLMQIAIEEKVDPQIPGFGGRAATAMMALSEHSRGRLIDWPRVFGLWNDLHPGLLEGFRPPAIEAG